MWTNIHVIGVPQKEERETGRENLLEEIMAENFPNLGKERHPDWGIPEFQTRGTQRRPHQDTLKLKCQKLKQRDNIKISRSKTISYKGTL